MAWCRQVTSHYLSQCWFLSPYDVTRPQWINSLSHVRWVKPCDILMLICRDRRFLKSSNCYISVKFLDVKHYQLILWLWNLDPKVHDFIPFIKYMGPRVSFCWPCSALASFCACFFRCASGDASRGITSHGAVAARWEPPRVASTALLPQWYGTAFCTESGQHLSIFT